MARLIAVQLAPGDRFSATVASIWAEGDAVLPLDPRLPAESLHLLLLAQRPHILIDHSGQNSLASPLEVPAGTAAVVMTSGTSGAPKGAVLSHEAMEASAGASQTRLGEDSEGWLSCVPMHHVAGLQILVRSRLLNSDPVVHSGFDPMDVVRDGRNRFVSMVPTMLRRMLDMGLPVDGFAAILLGGAPAPSDLLERAANAEGKVIRSYGMTETCGGVVYDGLPLDGAEVKIAPTGEVLVRGPMLFDGYRTDTEAPFTGDGWFRTADIGEIRTDGTLRVMGRADDVIVTGGENVMPAIVEAALCEHPGVERAHVFGEADDEWGERVVARVVTNDEGPDDAELLAWARNTMPPSHVPKEFRFVDGIAEDPKLLA